MKMFKLSVLLVLFAGIATAKGGRILFLMTVATKSETHLLTPMVNAMLGKGHRVTLVSPASSLIKHKDLIEIVPTKPFDMIDIYPGLESVLDIRTHKDNPLDLLSIDMTWVIDRCHQTFKHKDFIKHVLESNNEYDLIVLGSAWNECFLGVIHKLKAPFATIATTSALNFQIEPLGFRPPLSFVPVTSVDFSDEMSLKERILNVIGNYVWNTLSRMVFSLEEKVYKEYLGEDFPALEEMRNEVSVIFINTHFSMNFPRPSLPSQIEIGGLHCRPPKPLDKNIEKFVSEANHGVIFFSLGTVFKEDKMPESLKKAFINVFSRLKQRVLWKWSTIPGLPDNVMTSKWLQQQDILGHPNTKLFISHGGLLSTQEATYHGVPILGIPLFYDQDVNTKNVERLGYAKKLELLELNEEILEKAINEMLNDPKFRETAKKASINFRDQPQTPLERATFWLEYLIRHKGAPQLKSGSRFLNDFQYHLFDVQLIFLGLLGAIIFIVWKLISCCWKCCCQKKFQNDLSKKTQ